MGAKRKNAGRDVDEAGLSRDSDDTARLKSVLRWGLSLTLLIPFVVTPSLAFPYVTGKAIALRALVSALFIPWVLLLLRDKASRPRVTPILIAATAALWVTLVATGAGVNAHRSFWSTFERMEGALLQVLLYLLLMMVVSVFPTAADWTRIWQGVLGASALLATEGLLEWGGFVERVNGTERISGRFGNPVFLGDWMMVSVFIGALLLWKSRSTRRGFGAYSAATALALITLYLSGTRGALLGLAVGAAGAALAAALRSHGRARRIAVASLSVVLISTLGLYAFRSALPHQLPAATARVFNLSVNTSVEARLLIWRAAVAAIRERPMTGFGPENFDVALERHYDPNLWKHEPWFDRAHNTLLEWLVAAGLPGGLAYLALFAAALHAVMSSRVLDGQERRVLSGLLLAILVAGQVSFDSLTGSLLFMTLLAYLHTLSEINKRPVRGGDAATPRWGQALAVSLAVPAVLLTLPRTVVRPWQSAEAMAKAASLAQSAPWASLEAFQRSIALDTEGRLEATRQLLQTAVDLNAPGSSHSREIRTAFMVAAEKEMTLRAREAPDRAREPLLLGMMLVRFGHADRALPWLERAHDLSPARQMIAQELGNAYLMKGDRQKAFQVTKASYELCPSNLDLLRAYVVTAILAGRQDIFQPGAVDDGILLDSRIVRAAIAEADSKTLQRIWRAFVKQEASNRQVMAASAFRDQGDKAAALGALEAAARDNPALGDLIAALAEELRIRASS